MDHRCHIKPAVQWQFKKQEEQAVRRAVAEEEAVAGASNHGSNGLLVAVGGDAGVHGRNKNQGVRMTKGGGGEGCKEDWWKVCTM